MKILEKISNEKKDKNNTVEKEVFLVLNEIKFNFIMFLHPANI